jgi:23S rRNA (adenine2030-N6)-methyltransferase
VNYRHVYHAGNFADVFKHAVLALLLKALNAKDKPYCYIETHAGAGRYDLESEAANKTGEWRDGIGRLWPHAGEAAIAPSLARGPRTHVPGVPPITSPIGEFPELAEYLNSVRALNPGYLQPRYYPGSPRVAQSLLRPSDRLVLCELVEEEAQRLYAELRDDTRVTVRHQDGYAALKSLLPPPERRGLVLIDPPYESATEFSQALEALTAAHTRWATGVYAVWYPIKERAPVARLHREITRSGIRRVLAVELGVLPEDNARRLNGCGMLIVNPPWRLDDTLRELLPRLAVLLTQVPPGSSSVDWLVPE